MERIIPGHQSQNCTERFISHLMSAAHSVRLTSESLCARSKLKARLSGRKTFSPFATSQSILARVVKISPNTASTPTLSSLLVPLTSLAGIPARNVNNGIHVAQHPGFDTPQHAASLSERALCPLPLSNVCSLDLLGYSFGGQQLSSGDVGAS